MKENTIADIANDEQVERVNEYVQEYSENKVFLGGTCGNSKWREHLISLLEIDYFNPIVSVWKWNSAAQAQERYMRETCRFVLYVLTPETDGIYSIAEVVDDSNKRPARTIFCYVDGYNYTEFGESKLKSLQAVSKMVQRNGVLVFTDLQSVAFYLNLALEK